MAGNLEAWHGVVGGAWEWEGLFECWGIWGRGLEGSWVWEWEGLFEWLGIWGRGMELWVGPGSGRGFLNVREFGGGAWSAAGCGSGRGYLNGWEFEWVGI